MDEIKKQYVVKPLEEMNVIDDFLFSEIMADQVNGLEVCRMILSCVLRREVKNIHFTAQKIVPGISESSHGIRLDVYVTEENGDDIRVYDVEPDKQSSKKEGLPKRSRYYGDLIDTQLLSTGADYEKLPELVTIFILSYDPFGENAMYYEAGTVIKTHPQIPYNDGVRRIFLYVDGELSKESSKEEQTLKNLLRYINESIRANVIDDNTRKLDDIVKNTKARKEIGVRYMKSWEKERQVREEGLAEGKQIGKQIGEKIGKQELLDELVSDGTITVERAEEIRAKLTQTGELVQTDDMK